MASAGYSECCLPVSSPSCQGTCTPCRYCAAADLQGLQALGVRAHLVLPVTLGREVLGALCLAASQDNTFTARCGAGLDMPACCWRHVLLPGSCFWVLFMCALPPMA